MILPDNSASRTLSACLGNERIKATRSTISYRNHHQNRFDVNMDHLRDSFSRFKKDTKRRFGRSKRKGDNPGPGGREESVGSSSSFPQQESRASTGGGPDTEDENAGASTVAAENRRDWKSTASSSAKLVLRAVRESADAFGPLKSVAGGLCFILENCEV